MDKIQPNQKVKVKGNFGWFEGVVEKVEWDVDQWAYFVDGEWYCQSEVSPLI